MQYSKNQVDNKIRKESGGDSIYHPLSRRMLNNIFDPGLSQKLLNVIDSSAVKVGHWNKEHGIFIHNKSGIVFALLAQQSGLLAINNFLNNFDDAWTIPTKYRSSTDDIEQRLSLLSKVIGENVGLCHLYEYDSSDISDIIKRHFSSAPGYLFVNDKTNNYPGVISVYSVPTEKKRTELPASHPTMVLSSVADARSNTDKTDILGYARAVLDSEFSDTNQSYVPNVDPKRVSETTVPLSNVVVSSGDEIKVLRSGPVRLEPTIRIGQNSFINTASTVGRGTHNEFTYSGFLSNPGPSRPSSSFHPHPYWINSLFGSSLSIVKDPKVTAALIGLALLNFRTQKYKFITTYKQVNNIIDNEEIEKNLYGG